MRVALWRCREGGLAKEVSRGGSREGGSRSFAASQLLTASQLRSYFLGLPSPRNESFHSSLELLKSMYILPSQPQVGSFCSQMIQCASSNARFSCNVVEKRAELPPVGQIPRCQRFGHRQRLILQPRPCLGSCSLCRANCSAWWHHSAY